MEKDLERAMDHLDEKIQLLSRAGITKAWTEVKVKCTELLQQKKELQLELTECTEDNKRMDAAHDRRLREVEGLLVLLETEKEERQRDREMMERLRREEQEEQEKMEQIKSAEVKKLLLHMDSQREESERASRTVIATLQTKVEVLQVNLDEKNRMLAALMEEEEKKEDRERERKLENDKWMTIVLQLNEELKKKDEEMKQAREEALKELDRVRAERSVEAAVHLQKVEEDNRQLKEQLLKKEEEMLQERALWNAEKEQIEVQIQRLDVLLESVKQNTKKNQACQTPHEHRMERKKAVGEKDTEKFWRRSWRRLCSVFRRKD